MLNQAKYFAVRAHGDQKYGDKPYVYHLEAVVKLLEPYGEQAQIVGYLHDVVEDTDIKLETISENFGAFVADCVSILTDEPGANRKERKKLTYAKMAKVSGELELALVVKTADRLANIQACLSDNNTQLLSMYQKEHPVFQKSVYRKGLCDDLWAVIDQSIGI